MRRLAARGERQCSADNSGRQLIRGGGLAYVPQVGSRRQLTARRPAMDVSTASRRTLGSGESDAEDFSRVEETNMESVSQKRAPAGFSFVIDDVDGELDPMTSDSSRVAATSTEREPREETTPDDKEKSEARIQQIKGEAEIRKNQFAQLLEEHAQIMQRLKQMEEGPRDLREAEMGPTEV